MDHVLGVIEPEVVDEGPVFRECLRADAGTRLEQVGGAHCWHEALQGRE